MELQGVSREHKQYVVLSPYLWTKEDGPTHLAPPTCGVVSHCLGQHGLAAARRAVHEHATGWVDANLLVELKLSERQFNRLSHLLLLDVHPTCGEGGREGGRKGGREGSRDGG